MASRAASRSAPLPERPAASRPDRRRDPPAPIPILQGLVGLRRAAGLYPEGHPAIVQAAGELEARIREGLGDRSGLSIDIIRGVAHVDGVPFRRQSLAANPALLAAGLAPGVQSVHFRPGVSAAELRTLGDLLFRLQDGERIEGSMRAELDRLGVRHVTLGKIVPLDTTWRVREWPEAPEVVRDPEYRASLLQARDTFERLAEGRAPDARAVRDLLQLLVHKIAKSDVALGQILTIKEFENHTYCHSVNVAVLSLLLGRRIGLDDAAAGLLSEAALLHDIGKTRVPVEIIKKPGPLDAGERRIVQRHPRVGAEILVGTPGLGPLTPTVALEHHMAYRGGGYPEIQGRPAPHPLSQLVAVADIYEALTGARAYRDPLPPEQACLVLARMAGDQLNPDFVRAFVSTVTFFPIGSHVRTSRDELGVVVRTDEEDPLHPVIAVGDPEPGDYGARRIDTSERDADGAYIRHIVETLTPSGPGAAE